MRRIFITGGAGFIGSHLTEHYLEMGHEVYIIDDLSTGSLDNLKHLQSNEKYAGKLHIDVDSILNEKKTLEMAGVCDTVIHLAAAVGVKYVLNNPLDSITTNIAGTEMVLSMCHKFKKKVFIASTSEAYGKQTKVPLLETDDITFGSSGKARWSYAVAKLMDEFTGIAYYRSKNLPVVIGRLFNTVGPRQTGEYGMVIPRFINQALENQPLTIFGDGSQRRTFTHVAEVCKCIIDLMETESAYGEVVNIGGVSEVTIKELAEQIIAKTGSSSTLTYVPYDQVYNDDFEDMPRRVPSTDKLEKLIKFSPSRTLSDILDETIAFHKSNVK